MTDSRLPKIHIKKIQNYIVLEQNPEEYIVLYYISGNQKFQILRTFSAHDIVKHITFSVLCSSSPQAKKDLFGIPKMFFIHQITLGRRFLIVEVQKMLYKFAKKREAAVLRTNKFL